MPSGRYLFMPFWGRKVKSVKQKIDQAKSCIKKTDRTKLMATNFVWEQLNNCVRYKWKLMFDFWAPEKIFQRPLLLKKRSTLFSSHCKIEKRLTNNVALLIYLKNGSAKTNIPLKLPPLISITPIGIERTEKWKTDRLRKTSFQVRKLFISFCS